MRILILEDDPLLALDLQGIVEGCGHDVVGVCGSIASTYEQLDLLVDFAFLDIDLPDGKSFEVASRLAAREVPYAFVSASRPSEVPEALRGARFVAKPFSRASIRNALPADQRLAC